MKNSYGMSKKPRSLDPDRSWSTSKFRCAHLFLKMKADTNLQILFLICQGLYISQVNFFLLGENNFTCGTKQCTW